MVFPKKLLSSYRNPLLLESGETTSTNHNLGKSSFRSSELANSAPTDYLEFPCPSGNNHQNLIVLLLLIEIQRSAYILLCIGCTTAELTSFSDHVLQTPLQGWMMAIVMALLSGFAGVYTELIIKKRPLRNINVQNFWLYNFGMIFNVGAMLTQDHDDIMNKGFFHGYSLITVCTIINHALSGIAVSMAMKYANNIVKVYSTSVVMLLTTFISMILFRFHLTLPFVLGSMVVSVSFYLHSKGKAPR
ncbi:CMP-sialic acid transporter 2 [Cryptomeria japonica]|uniref:CMP-sialic acid transporter 2 n=1 Tax=Cryptomeria japonica TaxID=3369 RepID=UPI0027DA74DC|nr:CMP-sialic acid transporter 2 [Cryptomeria japonica]